MTELVDLWPFLWVKKSSSSLDCLRGDVCSKGFPMAEQWRPSWLFYSYSTAYCLLLFRTCIAGGSRWCVEVGLWGWWGDTGGMWSLILDTRYILIYNTVNTYHCITAMSRRYWDTAYITIHTVFWQHCNKYQYYLVSLSILLICKSNLDMHKVLPISATTSTIT